jgi:hypothetical protein
LTSDFFQRPIRPRLNVELPKNEDLPDPVLFFCLTFFCLVYLFGLLSPPKDSKRLPSFHPAIHFSSRGIDSHRGGAR